MSERRSGVYRKAKKGVRVRKRTTVEGRSAKQKLEEQKRRRELP